MDHSDQDVYNAVLGLQDDRSEETRLGSLAELEHLARSSASALRELADAAQTHDSSAVRLAALEALGRLGAGLEPFLPMLLVMLNSGREWERQRAARILGNARGHYERIVPALCRALRRSRSTIAVRSSAVLALGDALRTDPRALPAIVEALTRSSSPKVRADAAYALGAAGRHAADASGALIEVVEQDGSLAVRRAAAWALAVVGDPTCAAPVLLRVARECPDVQTRCYAAQVLAMTGNRHPEALAMLRDVLASSEDEEARHYAAWALKEFGPKGRESAISEMRRLAESGRNADVRRWSARSLREMGAPPRDNGTATDAKRA